jgi:pilus assembly protein CpaB
VTTFIYGLLVDARNALPAQKPIENAKVIVAATSIAPGWTIAPEHLQTRTLPVNYIPDEVYRTAEEVVGRVAMERILFGEFIREERLADPEAGVGLTAIIPRGMRAYQVKVRGGQQVSGFLNPGNFVDVLAVCTEANPPEARTILQSVTVLAVNDRMIDQSYDDPTSGRNKKKRVKPSVTLALTPEHTQQVKHAAGACDISLALRNDIDVTNIQSNDTPQNPSSVGPSGPIIPVEPAQPGSTGSIRFLHDRHDVPARTGHQPSIAQAKG